MNLNNHLWLSAPNDLTLLRDDVHVWRMNLDLPESQLRDLVTTLSSDELVRAERFYFQQHRERFIAGRGMLRNILGRYLGIKPSQVRFDYQQRGKPVLADAFIDSGLAFNLSHSQGLGLCGVSCDRQIGVDLEYIRPMDDIEALAKRFFLPREYELLRSLPLNQQQEVFFRYWTCKEAYLKATGDGISQLEQIEVSLTPTESAKLLTSEEWSLQELVPVTNYAAAIAIAGLGWHLKCWEFR
ncbi:MAG: 4'-phosphopantetheinyl transferase superfamily protein [Desmonostoc vinosum HA7617-LM4]|jgi:4'-phosphopantetheinyl transferase|nr:4'-phosphopantetheinyl transferase superfamily protein [Desmonostoc vinosum HA7617-LM4]